VLHYFRDIWRKGIEAVNKLGNNEALGELGDFTTTARMMLISLFAIGIGILSAFVALLLLRLIGLFTNLFFFQRWSTALVSPVGNKLGILEIFVPVIGAIIIGFMARYGSERIRGHGIPEAIEAILMNGSRMQPKVAVLKPFSSAISIGSGGPFGAEGPIIVTGGAIGSMVAQFFHLTNTERKTLLVAGAAGGMAATFASPVAAVLLAVELLLFEWKPRSLIPVGLASVTATLLRYYIIGNGPIFPTAPHPTFIGVTGLLGCVVVGLLAGVFAMVLTTAVYTFEDLFHRLPIHWMWWPALGGLVVGIGGLIFPQALGVGYDIIGSLVNGKATLQIILGVLIIKSIIWVVALSSGTSGGILAPLLMIGGALGSVEAMFLPNEGAGFWALISMSAMLGSAMRAPFTGIIFALELTHDVNSLLPLLTAVLIAHAFSVLFLRRSILTEKISRRGYHLSHEYATDPLEILFVREVMRTKVIALSDTISIKDLAQSLNSSDKSTLNQTRQRLYPVLDGDNRLVGVATRKDLQTSVKEWAGKNEDYQLAELIHNPIVAYPDEPLRVVVQRMAETGFTRLPVVERNTPYKLLGMVSLQDLLKARTRNMEEERHRERVLHIRHILSLKGSNKRKVPTKIEH